MINIYENIHLKGFDTVGEFTLCIEVGFRGKRATPELRFVLDNEKYFWTRPVDFYEQRNHWTINYGSGGEESCWPDEVSIKAKGEALLIAAKIVDNLNRGFDALVGLEYSNFEQCYE